MANGDPLLRKIIVGEFVKFHAWVLTALISGLFVWVWNTSAEVAFNEDRSMRNQASVQEISPQINQLQRDVDVIREQQKNQREALVDANKKLDLLLERQLGHANGR